MREFKFVSKNDYDEKIKFNNKECFVYSKKKINELYKNNRNYTLVGVAKENGDNSIGTLVLSDRSELKVFNREDVSKVFYRDVGYTCVGEDEYIAIVKSRTPFFIWFLCIVGAIILVGFGIGHILDKDPAVPVDTSSSPTTIVPDFPLPETDPNIEEVDSDVKTTPNANIDKKDDISGSAGLVYTLFADATLSTKSVAMMIENPATSNQALTIELLILSNGEEYSIAKSGLVTAGTRLKTMEMNLQNLSLSEGIYTGLYRISFYNSTSGEKALIQSELTDVKITVKN